MRKKKFDNAITSHQIEEIKTDSSKAKVNREISHVC